MQQVIQSIRNGKLTVAVVPDPVAHRGELLIANSYSVVSAGTERMLAEFGKSSILGKAMQRPDDVRRVLEKVRTDGIIPTLKSVRARLDAPMMMGYASAGIVLATGDGVTGYRPGDRVASNGPHAGVVSVGEHLCAKVPDSVPLDHAAFTVLGAIGLQGIRLANTQLGETVFVIGLGLVGQLAVGLLKAAGCRVIGTDPESVKCDTARAMGAEIARPGMSAEDVETLTGGVGADAVLIAASTKSNGPIRLAADAVRTKGRVVLVGVVGLELDRAPFFRKEAEFVVSCSYGPGRYDVAYESGGHDYPIGHVRWTEQRNLQAVLACMEQGTLDVGRLISHRFGVDRAADAYRMLHEGTAPYYGILLEHDGADAARGVTTIELRAAPRIGGVSDFSGIGGVGVIGAGNFAREVLLPEIAACRDLDPVMLCSKGGVTAATEGGKHGFRRVTTDPSRMFASRDVSAVFVATRHHLHAEQVIHAIESGKHVFVEKPLCLNVAELDAIEAALRRNVQSALVLMVGFNRRFAPATRIVERFFADVDAPITVSYRFNAGPIPAEHWTQHPEIGGGRIIGEACHAIDTVTFLTGSPPVRVAAESISGRGAPAVTDDQCFLTVRHANGAISSIAYLAGGDRAFARERVEVIGGGRIAVIDDYRRVTTVQNGKTAVRKLRKDKGHRAEIRAFADAVTHGGPAPISWRDLRAVSLASILAVRSLREGIPIEFS